MYMRPRSTPSPKSSVYPHNDVATYRDLLLFEERLKTNAASLQRRKSRYQRTVLSSSTLNLRRTDFRPVFLVQLLLIITFLLAEVLLPPDISLLAIPCKLVLRRVLPDIYTEDTEVHIHPYFSSGLLFVSVTTLALFFASGTYSDKIAYANKYVPHANRALRSFNMYLNVRKPPLHSKMYFNPLSFFFPRPIEVTPSSPGAKSPSSSPRPAIGSTSTSVPIPPIPPTMNPRGELRFSSRVDRTFREGYERYRANFERKRAQQEQLGRGHGWMGRITGWWRRDTPGLVSSAVRVSAEAVRSGTPPMLTRQKDKEAGGSPPPTPRRQRSTSPLQDTAKSDWKSPPSLGRESSHKDSVGVGSRRNRDNF
ncbi:hypothetical protein B0H11DRAFT_1346489 [Mycena galericulata]|nr:hypothetical protein B0H11DRAFT_1346489 [Mycena galericulata]